MEELDDEVWFDKITNIIYPFYMGDDLTKKAIEIIHPEIKHINLHDVPNFICWCASGEIMTFKELLIEKNIYRITKIE